MRQTQRHRDMRPSHPGELIANCLTETGVSKVEIAKALGVSRNTVQQLTALKQSVTAEMAVRLEAVLGSTAETWLHMQLAHDLWRARSEVDVSKLVRIAA